jgi:putative transposase
MIAREGFVVNHKKFRRIYTEEKLQVRRRDGRKRALGTRKPMVLPDGPNQRWSLDFMSDALTDGRRFHILAVVDDFNRENLVLVAYTSLSGHRVARELERIIAERGQPQIIVSDNGTEFTSMAILKWGQETGIDWHYIALESLSRTASLKVSTANCETNALTKRCLAHCAVPAKRLKNGRRITTGADHFQH